MGTIGKAWKIGKPVLVAWLCLSLSLNVSCTRAWREKHPVAMENLKQAGEAVLILAVIGIVILALAAAASGSSGGNGVNPNNHWVQSYTKADGTFVPGHYATNPNETINDNYSTIPNVNPYTGKPGTVPSEILPP